MSDDQVRESVRPQKRRSIRATDVIASKVLEQSDKEDPVTEVKIKYICSQANSHYSTLSENGWFWDFSSGGGIKYIDGAGKFRIKCKTYLRWREKLDRLDKIRENPEDHIFNEGGVSAD